MKKFLIICALLLIGQTAFSLEIVYPKKTNIKINSHSTFFIGSSNPKDTLTVNGNIVDVHKSGGFAYVVELKEGINTFEIVSGNDIQTFVINRPEKKLSKNSPQAKFIQYEKTKEVLTSANNIPLRSTPVDAGINRMSHFQEGIPLLIDGEKSNFYRVTLGENKKAWISKSNVKQQEEQPQNYATFLGYDYKDTEDYHIFTFRLDKKVPYEIIEGSIFYLKLYNVKDHPDNTYIYTFPYSAISETSKIAGYSCEYKDNNLIWKIRKFPTINPKQPLKNITIALDAGHGGKDNGATGCLGDKEKDINLEITKYLEKELEKRSAKVIMTRTDDQYVSLQDRIDKANAKDAMFLISIHGNALPDHLNPLEHKGTSIYFYYNQAKLLAANILSTMNEQLGTQNDQIRQGSLALVRNTNALSILIEVAYLINPEDNVLLINPKFQKKCAKAIADGIENFLTAED